jgi:hypothetical protein
MPEPTKAFTAREACTVLASLRTFQIIRNCERPGFRKDVTFDATTICDMEHFENVEPLSVEEIDALCERITIDWLPEIEKAGNV